MAVNLVNGRCYLTPVVETFAELKVNMTPRHWEIIRRTPFAAFTELEAIYQERALLDSLLQRYDGRTNKFRIGESLLSFRPQDVALVLGLRCDDDAVVF